MEINSTEIRDGPTAGAELQICETIDKLYNHATKQTPRMWPKEAVDYFLRVARQHDCIEVRGERSYVTALLDFQPIYTRVEPMSSCVIRSLCAGSWGRLIELTNDIDDWSLAPLETKLGIYGYDAVLPITLDKARHVIHAQMSNINGKPYFFSARFIA